jgi:hypothetical protein
MKKLIVSHGTMKPRERPHCGARAAAYRVMADALEADMLNPDSRYTNPGNAQRTAKKSRYDPSKERASWVAGCSAAPTQRDSIPIVPARGFHRGRGAASRARAQAPRGFRHGSLAPWKGWSPLQEGEGRKPLKKQAPFSPINH